MKLAELSQNEPLSLSWSGPNPYSNVTLLESFRQTRGAFLRRKPCRLSRFTAPRWHNRKRVVS